VGVILNGFILPSDYKAVKVFFGALRVSGSAPATVGGTTFGLPTNRPAFCGGHFGMQAGHAAPSETESLMVDQLGVARTLWQSHLALP
jgi:hypothetical protein